MTEARHDTIGRRAAFLTLALAGFLVVGYLLLAANLAILLASGAEPNALGGNRTSAWLEWRGRFSVIIPWWAFVIPAAGWVVVLSMVWAPERTYLRRVGPLALMAFPALVAVLSFLTAFLAVLWAYWYYVDGWLWYLLPAMLLVVNGIVASARQRVLNR